MMQEQHLIGDIYDAAINSQLWPQVTATLADVCGGEKVMLAATDVLQPGGNFQFTHKISAADIAVWRQQGFDALEVELHERWMANVPPSEPSSSDEFFGGPEGFRAAAGAFYDMLYQRNIRRQMVVMFDKSHYRLAGVGLNNFEPFPPHSAPALKRLSPHLSRAVEIHRQLVRVRSENDHLYQMLDLLSTGVVLLDVGERIRYANPVARRQLQQHGGLTVRNEGLLPHDLGIARRLHALVRSAIHASQRGAVQSSAAQSSAARDSTTADGAVVAGGVLGMPAPAGGQALTISVMPLSSLAAYRDLSHDRIAAALFISQARGEHDLPLAALQDLYRLTPREAQACQAFVNGADLENVATALGVQLSTVRSMMKVIYQKTGQDSQAGLMRMLMEARLNFRHLG